MGGDGYEIVPVRRLVISIHASRMGGDVQPMRPKSFPFAISIHASRMGGDPMSANGFQVNRLFQSTPPGWEATVKMDTPFHDMERIFILVINRTALY